MRRVLFSLLAVLALCAGAVPASAQVLGGLEVRGGVMARGVDRNGIDVSHVEDLNFEALFTAPMVDSFVWLGKVRPHVGTTVNLDGHESMVYAGLSWTVPVTNSFFVEASFGGAIHNGPLHGALEPERNLGCSVLFRESASVGANLTESTDIMLTIEHASHAGLCGDDNRGITNLGVRVGFKF